MNKFGLRYFHCFSIQLAKKPKVAGSSEGKNALLGRSSSKLSVGIVGLANVGKSTFFQAITKSELGNPNNYPFATVKPEEALYQVPSTKLNDLYSIYKSEKVIPSYLKIVDIAGLVRNASKGEGLGNQFLNDIRNVDGIFQVVRGFDDAEITHIENSIDPVRDLEIVTDELLLKDLETAENSIEKNKKLLKGATKGHERKQVVEENAILQKLIDLMTENGRLLNNSSWTEAEVDVINKYKFLTAKPTLYLLNVSRDDYLSGENKYLERVQNWVNENSPNEKLIMFSANHEHDEFILQENEHSQSTVINEMVNTMKDELNLISFYTMGEKEAREWNIKKLSTAPEGAGLIHTDLQKNFINVNVLKYDKLMDAKDQIHNFKDIPKIVKDEKHGKDYLLEDGDVVLFKSVGGKTR